MQQLERLNMIMTAEWMQQMHYKCITEPSTTITEIISSVGKVNPASVKNSENPPIELLKLSNMRTDNIHNIKLAQQYFNNTKHYRSWNNLCIKLLTFVAQETVNG